MKKIYILIGIAQVSFFCSMWGMKEGEEEVKESRVPSLQSVALQTIVDEFLKGSEKAAKQLEEMDKRGIAQNLKDETRSWIKMYSCTPLKMETVEKDMAGGRSDGRDYITAIAFTPRAHYFAIGCKDGHVEIWDLNTYTRLMNKVLVLDPPSGTHNVQALGFMSDEELFICVATQPYSVAVRLCSLNITTQKITDYTLSSVPTDNIKKCLGMSYNSRFGAFFLKNNDVLIWDLVDKKQVGVIKDAYEHTFIDISVDGVYASFINTRGEGIKLKLKDDSTEVLKIDLAGSSFFCNGILLSPRNPNIHYPIISPDLSEPFKARMLADFTPDGRFVLRRTGQFLDEYLKLMDMNLNSFLPRQFEHLSEYQRVKCSPLNNGFILTSGSVNFYIWGLSRETETEIDGFSLRELIRFKYNCLNGSDPIELLKLRAKKSLKLKKQSRNRNKKLRVNTSLNPVKKPISCLFLQSKKIAFKRIRKNKLARNKLARID